MTSRGEFINLRVKGLRAGTSDVKQHPRNLAISIIAKEPSQLHRDVRHRAGADRTLPQIITDDDTTLSEEEYGDDRVPPQNMPDDEELRLRKKKGMI